MYRRDNNDAVHTKSLPLRRHRSFVTTSKTRLARQRRCVSPASADTERRYRRRRSLPRARLRDARLLMDRVPATIDTNRTFAPFSGHVLRKTLFRISASVQGYRVLIYMISLI